MSLQGTKKTIFSVLFRIGLGIMTTMFLQNTISRFNFFRIESFDSRVCYFGKLRMKTVECRCKEQRRPFSEFSFELALALGQHFFCKIPFPDSTSLELRVLIAECATLESYRKNICSMLQQGTEKSIFRVIF